MAFKFREWTDADSKTLADYQQRVICLETKKADIITERTTAEVGWAERVTNIESEIAKNTSLIANVRPISISGKVVTYAVMMDADVKTITDLDQQNKGLMLKKADVQNERAAAEIVWRNRNVVLDAAIHTAKDAIAYMREPTEVADKEVGV